MANTLFIVLTVCALLPGTLSRLPKFFRGRPRDGFVGSPPVGKTTLEKGIPPEQYMFQRLDHFNDADTRTWQQKYYMNSDYYGDGGPVFLMIGGEGPLSGVWMNEGAWVEYAKVYNAMLFSIEHRFYGKSHPTSDMSVDNLQYLSSEQALADNAYFINYATQKYNLIGNKWISFGGSYSGSLSAWQRLKYPHLIDGAVATSAPLLAELNFYQYLDVTQASLATTGSVCNEAILEGTQTVDTMITTDSGRRLLKAIFRLCDDIDITNELDVQNFYATLANNFEGVVQYNKDNRAFEGGAGSNITIDTLCDIMSDTSKGSGIQRLAAVNDLMLSTYEEKCLDFSYTNMIDALKETSWNASSEPGGRQWTYQTCTEFGFFQTSDFRAQPFGHNFPLSFFVQQCKDIFGAKFDDFLISAGINRTNTNYGAQNIKASKIVFPNGSIDQWHILGKLTDLPDGSVGILINGTAHCANMYPSSPNDSPQLTAARAQIQKLIGQWIQ